MASNIDFVNFVMEQINDIGIVSQKKMFGEYMVYVNQKPIVLVCDNIAYLKKWDCIKGLCVENEVGFPYNGAKEHYILDVDDKETLAEIIREVERVAQIPKKRDKKNKEAKI